MAIRLKEEFRHVGVGVLLGLVGVLFGITWAVYITVNHEQIHNRLAQAQGITLEEKFVMSPGAGHEGHEGHGAHQHATEAAVHHHDGQAAGHAPHDTPEMAAAHERLARGHAHAMGLGILSMVMAVIIAFMPAPARAKTFAAACVGTGGLFYPLSWIVMGMRTTALGIHGAAESVLPMVGMSVGLVGLGVMLTLAYALKWLVRG